MQTTAPSLNLNQDIENENNDNGRPNAPCGLCLVAGRRHIAVADAKARRVTVFSTQGHFIRHVSAGDVCHPTAVACSGADPRLGRVAALEAGGSRLFRAGAGAGACTGVTIHGGTLYCQSRDQECVVFV
jgi:hypothetical protein